MTQDPNDELARVMQDQKEFLLKALKQPIQHIDEKKSTQEVFYEKEQEVRPVVVPPLQMC